METEGCVSTQLDAALYQLKIAAALAVLRNKPAGADVVEYTKRLSAQYLQAQTIWRSRYLQAKDALVHMKQQHLISCSHTAKQDAASVDDDGYPLTPPSSGVEAEGSSAMSTLLPISSQQALVSSCQFIHSVVNMSSAFQIDEESEAVTANQTAGHVKSSHTLNASSIGSLLSETVPTCVRHLRMVVSHGSTDVSTNCIMRGLDGLLILLAYDWTECGYGEPHSHLLLTALAGLVDDLLQRLFEPGEDDLMQSVQSRQLLHKMLLRLTTKLRDQEKQHLLQSLAGHVQKLCHGISNNCTTDPSFYECLAIALNCLQQGVLSMKDFHGCLREIQLEVESVLDSNLIHKFPLVANAILRLTSFIEMCSKD